MEESLPVHKQITPSTLESFLVVAPAIQAGNLVFTRGLVARHAQGYTVGAEDCAEQVRFCLEQLQDIMAGAGSGLENVAHLRTFVSDARYRDVFITALGEWFPEVRPALSVIVNPMVHKDLMLEVEAVGCATADGHNIPTVIRTTSPGAVEPGIEVSASQIGDLLFLSGLSAQDSYGKMAGIGSCRVQADTIFQKMNAILSDAGTSMANVVKLLTVLANPLDSHVYDIVFQHWFPKDPPATTLLVCPPTNPGQLIQIEAIAAVPGSNGEPPARKVIQPAGMEPGVDSAAVQVGNFLFTKGITSRDGDGNFLEVGSCGRQVPVIFEQMQAILREAGGSIDNVVKTLIFIRDPLDYPSYNEMKRRWVPQTAPGSSTLIASSIHKELLVSIEAVALVPSRST